MASLQPLRAVTNLAPVRVAANTNQTGTYVNGTNSFNNNAIGATFTYAAGVTTIDSVAVALGDYILFSAQTLGYQNGIYQVTALGTSAASTVLTRRSDFQCLEQIQLGSFVPVYAGTTYAGAIFTVIEPAAAGMGVPTVSGANNIVFGNSSA